MRIATERLMLDLHEARPVAVQRQPMAPALANVSAAVRDALEYPFNFPALRRALTPDDHIAIVVDEQLADLPQLLTPILEHLLQAHITPDAVTLVCTDAETDRGWVEHLPPAFAAVKVEEHDPANRKKLSYLATTKQGRRVYLNRTAVDADQLIVLSRRGYDPLLGVGGAEGAIYPALGDSDTRQATMAHLSMAAPGAAAWPVHQEAVEVVWLLGAPFFVQVVQGSNDEIAHVIAGPIAAGAEAERLLEARWHVEVDEPADVVIALVGGDPARHTFADLARALAAASRVVRPEGKIVLVSGGQAHLGPGAQLLRQADTPDEALRLLTEQRPPDWPAAFQWASAARAANLYLLSQMPAEVVEEMFAVPLDHAGQVQRLAAGASCLVLEDADRILASVRPR